MNWWMLRRTLHTSWLIAALALGVVGGVMLAAHVPAGWFSSLIWLMSGAGVVAVGLWARWWIMVAPMLLGGLLVGLWRGATSLAELRPYDGLIGSSVTIRAKVSDDVDRDARGDMVMRLSDVRIGTERLPGAVRAVTSRHADSRRGDYVTVKGRVSDGFGSFAITLYRADLIRLERPEPGDVARQVRDGFANRVRAAIAEPAASLGLGFLLGQRRGLPESLDEALRVAGLTHIVVASGYNLTILVRLARRTFVKLSKYLAALSAGSMIVGFIAVTGMSPSMSRAGLVAGLSLLAWYYGRKFHPLVLLPFAAAVTLCINPSYGWGDLGWQLSFAAFAGVMIVAPLGQRYFFGETNPGLVRQILGETVAAFVVTLPILLVAFGQASMVAIVANLLVVPLVPLAMLLTFATGVMILLAPVVAEWIGQLAEWLLGYMVSVATGLSALPWAQVEWRVPVWLALGYYAVLIAGCIYVWRVTGYRLREANLVE